MGGFTKNPNSGVSPDRRGTYAGVIEKIPYLKDLGITVVELMPIFQFDPQEGSCWGYMPLNFFSPHHGYSSRPSGCDQHNEFRAMVKALHDADIEVILDVVYNHTAEGDQRGPVYSYKGIDNSTYYLMSSPVGKSVRQLLRNRKHAALFQSMRPQVGRGQRALLGRGDARRRFSLRLGLRVSAQR